MPTMTDQPKRKRGRPASGKRPPGSPNRHIHPRIAIHLEAELLAALNAFCDAQRLKPDRSEVVRLALREFLEREGHWPPPAPPAGA